MDGIANGRPIILGHRGASGMYPEHTALAYEKAAEQGADYVECDLTVTKVRNFSIFSTQFWPVICFIGLEVGLLA